MADVARRKHGEMVRGWSANRLRLAFVPEVQYPLIGGQGAYTIGPAATDFDTNSGVGPSGPYVKPIFVQSARVKIGTARRWSLNILTRPQWDLIQNRDLLDPDGPLDFFYDFNTPIATINMALKPQFNTTLYLSQWNPLRQFSAGEEALNIEDFYPQEYIKPMQTGLAIELAQAYKLPVSQELVALFADSIQTVERMNNDKLSGAFGSARTLEGPTKGDGSPVQGQQ